VTGPVALWPATTEAETIRFNLMNPETNNRIRSDLVQGFEAARLDGPGNARPLPRHL
jgi:DNA end-binding protein Ku